MPRAPADICPKTFRDHLRELGFAYLGGSADCFIDLLNRRTPTIAAVRVDKQLHRAASIAACIAARGRAETIRRAAEAAAARRQRIADRIAPQALPAARATLSGTHAVAQLADDFRTMATRSDSVTFKDLMLAGWTETQVREHGDAARRLAQQQANGAMA